MTLSSDISTTSTALNDIKNAIINKGVTPSGNITTYAAAINNIPTSSEFQLTRFKDDTNTEIGTHYMNFTDGNGNEYKVILLDAKYRNDSAQWCSNYAVAVTNMPLYNDNFTNWWYNGSESATENTQLILDYCTTNGYTSTACSHCRSKSFIINGTTYYGQLPNMREVFDIWRHRADIESMDTSASSHSSTNFSSARYLWSSTQYSGMNGWNTYNTGSISNNIKTANIFACPVLEIPLT